SLCGGQLYLGGWSPLCTGAGPGGSLGEGVDDDGCRMFLRVLLLLRRRRGRVPWVRRGRDRDGWAGGRRHRARPAAAAPPGRARAPARRAGGGLARRGRSRSPFPGRRRDREVTPEGRD